MSHRQSRSRVHLHNERHCHRHNLLHGFYILDRSPYIRPPPMPLAEYRSVVYVHTPCCTVGVCCRNSQYPVTMPTKLAYYFREVIYTIVNQCICAVDCSTCFEAVKYKLCLCSFGGFSYHNVIFSFFSSIELALWHRLGKEKPSPLIERGRAVQCLLFN